RLGAGALEGEPLVVRHEPDGVARHLLQALVHCRVRVRATTRPGSLLGAERGREPDPPNLIRVMPAKGATWHRPPSPVGRSTSRGTGPTCGCPSPKWRSSHRTSPSGSTTPAGRA